MKKTIAIISPDAIAPSPSTALGNRISQLAEAFSRLEYDVTIFLPDINYNPELIYNYNIVTYDYNHSLCTELDLLLKYTIVLLPSNLTLLQRYEDKLFGQHPHLILDGWVPLLAEYGEILSYKEWPNEMKSLQWSTTKDLYFQYIQHSQIILCANTLQEVYYKCVLQSLDYLNNIYKVHVIPYALKPVNKLYQNQNKDHIKLLWYGVLYPWYDLIPLLETVKKYNHIELHCVGLKHPRYSGYYASKKYLLQEYTKFPNIKIMDSFLVEDPIELFNQYDAAIMLSKNSIENQLSHRTRIFDMLNYGIPIITNCGHVITKEYSYMDPLLKRVSVDNLYSEVTPNTISSFLEKVSHVDIKSIVKQFQEQLSIEQVTEKLSKLLI